MAIASGYQNKLQNPLPSFTAMCCRYQSNFTVKGLFYHTLNKQPTQSTVSGKHIKRTHRRKGETMTLLNDKTGKRRYLMYGGVTVEKNCIAEVGFSFL